jgi:hypothetical protein
VSKKGFYLPIYEIKPIKNLMSKYKVPYYISPFNERVVTVKGFETQKVKDGWISTPAPHVSSISVCVLGLKSGSERL